MKLTSVSSIYFAVFERANQKETEYSGNEVEVKQQTILSLVGLPKQLENQRRETEIVRDKGTNIDIHQTA